MNSVIKAAVFWASLFLLAARSLFGEVNIQSDSLNILRQGAVTKFTGNVSVRSKDLTLEADEALSNRETGIVTAAGSVKVNYSSAPLDIVSYSTRTVMDTAKNIITMTGSVKNIIDSEGEDGKISRIVVYSDKVIINYADRRKLETEFIGAVKVDSEKIKINSGRALYKRDQELITFTDSPRAYSETKDSAARYSGKTILFYIHKQSIALDGDAQVEIELDESQM
ncbi:MAG: LptA/OstA family protein [Elusimicrobiota bacterium]|nr:LptA/OstA family protein [Elusimicrobiota bacterium]